MKTIIIINPSLIFMLVVLAVFTATFLSLPMTQVHALSTDGVHITDNVFLPASLTVDAGTTVTWKSIGINQHTVTADNFLFSGSPINPGDLFSFTFNTPGTYPYHCKIHGASGGIGMSGVIIVKAVPIPPVITSPLTTTGQLGVPFSYQITANNNPTSFNVFDVSPPALLSSGLSLNTNTGLISGIPSIFGDFTINLEAISAKGTVASAILSLSFLGNPLIPMITSPAAASGTAGKPFSYQIKATNNPTSFDALGSSDLLGFGLSLNTNTGLISGVPNLNKNISVILKAANSNGTGTAKVFFLIKDPAVPMVITSPAAASGFVGSPFSYQITATNNPTQFSASFEDNRKIINGNPLPPGLTIDTQTGIISGIPQINGVFNLLTFANNSKVGADFGGLKLLIFDAPKPPQNPRKLAVNSNGHSLPRISGTKVVFTGIDPTGPIGSEHIFLHDLATNQTRNLTVSLIEPMNRYQADIHGNRVAWFNASRPSATDGDKLNIFTINLYTNQIDQVSFGLDDDENPIVSDQYIAWQAFGSSRQLKVYDVITKTSQVITSDFILHTGYTVSGDWVVWGNTTGSILGRNLKTNEELVLAQFKSGRVLKLDMDGDRVVWQDNKGTDDAPNYDIFMYDFSTGRVQQLTNHPANQGNPRISGKYVVYSDDSLFTPSTGSHPNLFLYNLDTRTEQQITTEGDVGSIDISQGRIVFTRLRADDVYIFEIPGFIPSSPVIGSLSGVMGTVEIPFSHQITATNNPTSFRATSLPNRLSIDRATGLISGTPTVFGTFNVILKAINAGGIGTYTWALTINPKFSIGNQITVTKNKIKVRATPSGKIIGSQILDAQGTIIGGPIIKKRDTWWQIDYVITPDGWSAENYLTKVKTAMLPQTISSISIQLPASIAETLILSPEIPKSLLAKIEQKLSSLLLTPVSYFRFLLTSVIWSR